MKINEFKAQHQDQHFHEQGTESGTSCRQVDDLVVQLLFFDHTSDGVISGGRIYDFSGNRFSGDNGGINPFSGKSRGQPGSITHQPGGAECISPVIVVDQCGSALFPLQIVSPCRCPLDKVVFKPPSTHIALWAVGSDGNRLLMGKYPAIAVSKGPGVQMPFHFLNRTGNLVVDARPHLPDRYPQTAPDRGGCAVSPDQV